MGVMESVNKRNLFTQNNNNHVKICDALFVRLIYGPSYGYVENVLLLCNTHKKNPYESGIFEGKMVIQTHSLIRVIFLTLFQLKTIRSSSIATNKAILVKENVCQE